MWCCCSQETVLFLPQDMVLGLPVLFNAHCATGNIGHQTLLGTVMGCTSATIKKFDRQIAQQSFFLKKKKERRHHPVESGSRIHNIMTRSPLKRQELHHPHRQRSEHPSDPSFKKKARKEPVGLQKQNRISEQRRIPPLHAVPNISPEKKKIK